MWWWSVVALAGPMITEAQTQRLAIPYPTGVTSTLTTRELIPTAPRPSTVTFTVDARPTLRDGLLVVRGVLANTASVPATVYLVSAPHTGGPFLLAARDVVFTPPPADAEHPPLPETFPTPEELLLPAGATVVFESALRLDRWTWPPSGAFDIDWTFAYWKEPMRGTLPGQLAKRP